MSSVAGQLFNAQIFPILIQSVNEGIHRENVDDATRKLCSIYLQYWMPKKFSLNDVWPHCYSFKEWPLSVVITSASSKQNLLESIRFLPVSLKVSNKSPRCFLISKEKIPSLFSLTSSGSFLNYLTSHMLPFVVSFRDMLYHCAHSVTGLDSRCVLA